MKTITKLCFSGLLVATLASCQADSNVNNVVTADSYTKNIPMAHGKPGASVSLVNSKVNLANADVQYSINLGIDSRYSSGKMEVDVSSSEGLQIVSGDTDIQETLTKGAMTFPFEVTATENGRYYLYAVVKTESNGVKSFRALTMIVQVAEHGETKKTETNKKTPNKKDVTNKDKTFGAPILLKADEEIIQ